MKYIAKILCGTIVVCLLWTVFGGCAQKSAEYAGQSISENEVQMSAYDSGIDGGLALIESRPAEERAAVIDTSTRKLITNANIEIRTENLETGADTLNVLMEKYNAYTSSVSIYENVRNYTIKVESAKYTLFFNELTGLGKVINYTESTEDVTMRYYDLESRLDTKKALLKIYQSYLLKAANIEEILAVESKIAELQSETDEVGKQFRLLNNLIDYSTIYVEMRGPVTAVDYGKETIGERIKEMLSGFGYYVATIVIILLGIVVYGIPAIVILALLYWLLLGKIGLLKKVYQYVSGKKSGGKS